MAAAFILGLSREVLPAQVVIDSSWGRTATALPGPAFKIPDTLGKTVGNNLFHSFQTFNLSAGQSATFTGPDNIANVLTRVTGGSPSTIDGTLACTMPYANFYFINPAGVVFGPNAQVDVHGAFAVTTADYVRLADGGRFDARVPANDVLTLAPPSAFGFLAPQAGQSIAGVNFQGSQLQIGNGQTFTVAAGKVTATADASTGKPAALTTAGGTLQVAAVASAGELPVDGIAVDGFSDLGDLELSGGATWSSGGGDIGGRFLIRGNNLTLSGGATIDNTTGNTATGLDSQIQLRGKLQLADASNISVDVYDQAVGGNLSLQAREIELSGGSGIHGLAYDSGTGGNLSLGSQEHPLDSLTSDGGYISLANFGQGETGTMTIWARHVDLRNDFYDLWGDMYPSISGFSTADGKGAAIQLNAGDISLSSASINTETMGKGEGKPLVINAQNGLSLDPLSEINATAQGAGNSGGIVITAHTLANQGTIWTDAFGLGNAGDITLRADSLSLQTLLNPLGLSCRISASSQASGAGGNAGRITISPNTAGTLTLELQNARIEATTSGLGNAGSILVQGADALTLDNHSAISVHGFGFGSLGEAGSIQLSANQLALRDGSTVSAITYGNSAQNQAGQIAITAASSLTLESGSTITSSAMPSAGSPTGGNGGEILVTAPNAQVSISGEGSGIFASTQASGKGGEVHIEAASLCMSDHGVIATTASASGDAGDLYIAAGTVQVQNSATINSKTLGQGNGGNVQISAGTLLLDDKAEVSASSTMDTSRVPATGNAGDIRITAQQVSVQNGSRISSQTWGPGSGGTISLQADTSLQLNGAGSVISVESFSSGNAGDIAIRAGAASLQAGARISSSTRAAGNGGSIALAVDGKLTIDGMNSAVAAETQGAGHGGDLDLTGRDLAVANLGEISVSTAGAGTGGAARLDLSGNLLVQTGGRILAETQSRSGGGNGGELQVKARDIELDGGFISSSTYGNGQSGSVSVAADEALTVKGTAAAGSAGILSRSLNPGAAGDAGAVSVTANQIEVLGGGTISSAASGSGKGGSVAVTARAGLILDGQGAGGTAIAADSTGSGDAGSITVTSAGGVQILNGAAISSSASGSGRGGSIVLTAEGQLVIDGGGYLDAAHQAGTGLRAESLSTGQGGNAGDIQVNAADLQLRNRATITSTSAGSGDAGTISITTPGLVLSDASEVLCQAEGSGNAGSILISSLTSMDLSSSTISVKSAAGNAGTVTLKAPGTLLLRNSQVSAEAFLNGGNISIDPHILGLVHSTLKADAIEGNGGNITVVADFLYSLDLPLSKAITADSQNQSAQPGTISLRSGLDFASSLVSLPAGLLNQQGQLREGCARKHPKANSFMLRGAGGLCSMPDSLCPNYDLALGNQSRNPR